MPVRFNEELPAFAALRDEGVWVEPAKQAPRSLPGMGTVRVGIVNLMPLKEPTELQLLRMMGRSPVMVDIDLIVPDDYVGKNTPPEYLQKFYKRFSDIKDDTYDGFILTGAPIEHLPFEEVGYWKELSAFMERVKDKREGLLSLCWGAMATLWYFHQIPKHMVSSKIFGLYKHDNMSPKAAMMQGLPLHIGVPVSRHTTWKDEDFEGKKGIEVLMHSDESGPSCVWDPELCHVHMINHFEYDRDTLHGEYLRDLTKGTPTGEPIHIPRHYYPADDPARVPPHKWASAGQVFYSNWLLTLMRNKAKREGVDL
uniref:Homoserine O-succinyltransferase n=1 Tax=Hemiselmis andersenii TaxID=464988 RepID=A0A6U2A4Z6_HEMAN